MAQKNTWIIIAAIVAAIVLFGSKQVSEMSLFESPQASSSKPLFDVRFLSPPTMAIEGKDVSYNVEVRNVGAAGTLYVDSGLYPQSQIESWYGRKINLLFALQTKVEGARPCVPGETFVDRKQVTLDSGASTTVTFNVVAPKKGTYYLHAGSFEKCWERAGDEGYRTGRVSQTPVIVSKMSAATVTDEDEEERFDFAKWWENLGAIKWVIVGFIAVLLFATLFPQKAGE